MVPESRDVILSTEEEKALWQTCFTAAPEQRREREAELPKGRKKSPALLAEPHHDCRCAHGSGKAQKHGSLACRRGGYCGVQEKNTFALE